jgi:hypothetical protein
MREMEPTIQDSKPDALMNTETQFHGRSGKAIGILKRQGRKRGHRNGTHYVILEPFNE